MNTGLDAVKTASKIKEHKASEFMRNKIADAVTKSNWETRTCWRNNYSARKNRRNIKQIEKSNIKMKCYKISKSLNGFTVSKFVTKNGSK